MLKNVRATVNAATGATRALHGWVITETAGAAARCILRKGTVSGEIIADVRLAAAETKAFHVADGVGVGGPIYVEQNTGAVGVNLYVA